ncbi:Nitric oxide synthase interacting protein [Seminavis robusta]|uniref:Nitric oxide synthase interacting protein n=1 Tax=Seminavis robusta TaxID=568900 RepID=A0A9N8HXY2_9STRA|nr:Nitric oxide synthase interacting protein [Seminavis robusta]|eukprot:Sro2660_g333950.1 Nitric oxide synthase interacting protein (312) ;mRNA; f:5084-6019
MGRKSKQAGSGHMPLTHYERTKKFKSSSFGTTTTRLSGDSQVAFGHCSLGLTVIMEDGKQKKKTDDNDETLVTTIAMVTPSGHLYAKEAIFEYLLTKTQEYQDQLALFEQQQDDDTKKADTTEATKRKRQEAFDASHNLQEKRIKHPQQDDSDKAAASVLKRTSYWLPDMQPDKVDARHKAPERPTSPYSGEPLRRKDLRELALERKPNTEDVICAISGKAIRMQPTMAYWTKDKTKPGVVVLKDVYHMTIDTEGSKKKKAKGDDEKDDKPKLQCPLTNQKIKHVIELKVGGSGFAAHNAVEVKTYKPTIT